MAEKTTATKKVAKKSAEPAKAEAKKVAKKAAPAEKKAAVSLTAEHVGFRAGDVYQALAAAGKALSVAEVAKAAKMSHEEAYLGIGWLLKEGKVKDAEGKVALA